jgi:hypothetical protein
MSRRIGRARGVVALTLAAFVFVGCGQTLHLGGNDFELDPSFPTSIIVPQGGTLDVTVHPSGDAVAPMVSVRCRGGPVDCKYVAGPPGPVPTGTVTFTANSDAKLNDSPPDSPPVTIDVADGALHVRKTLVVAVTIAVVAKISGDTSGSLDEFVSTSLQPATFQTTTPDIGALEDLTQHPIHVQLYTPPWSGTDETEDASEWSFTDLNNIVVPLLDTNAKVQLQIATPPNLAKYINGPGHFDYMNGLDTFVDYCARLVTYYNAGGFSWKGVALAPIRSGGAAGIPYWSILNDYNNENHDTRAYLRIFNAAAARMRQVDPSIQFSALEFTDDVTGSNYSNPDSYFPDFLQTDAGVGSIAVHMFATTLYTTGDLALFQTVPKFASHVKSILAQRSTSPNPDLAAAPVWVTQANVDSDYPVKSPDGGPRTSNNNDGNPFVLDGRGNGPFFAAWAPLLFSRLGQAGSSALFHWNYTSGHDPGAPDSGIDDQNAEVNYDSARKYRSYWVDKWLGATFPTPPGQDVLKVILTDAADPTTGLATVEVLAARNKGGGPVAVMVVDIASSVTAPNTATLGGNGGSPRTVIVDVSALGIPFASLKTVTIDDLFTDFDSGPQPTTTPSPPGRVPVSLHGYGVAFLTFTPPP